MISVAVTSILENKPFYTNTHIHAYRSQLRNNLQTCAGSFGQLRILGKIIINKKLKWHNKYY